MLHFGSHALELTAMDARRLSVIRLTLAVVALAAIIIDPAEPDRYVTATYTVLALYVAYSLALLAYAWDSPSFDWSVLTPWLDSAWYVVLIGLSNGTNSLFFFFFFFAILVASFQHGFGSGCALACVSALLFSSVGWATAPSGQAFELNRSLLRPASLLGLGYLMAYWGGRELTLRRQLILLRELSRVENPRFGVEHMLAKLLEQLRAFYDADVGLLVMSDPHAGGHSVRRADRHDPRAALRAEAITENLACLLLALPATHAAVSCRAPHLHAWWRQEAAVHAYNVETDEEVDIAPQSLGLPDARAFMTAPLRHHGQTLGRLLLTASRRSTFHSSDVRFLVQALAQTLPTIENIRVVDQLASTAAAMERQRLTCNMHDSIIQSCIGLKIGLLAIDQKLALGHADVREDLKQLLAGFDRMSAELRFSIQELSSRSETADDLLSRVQNYAARFARETGLAVHVTGSDLASVPDRLAAEIVQMVAEGLSNVRRHTRSTQARLSLAGYNDHLLLRIANDRTAGEVPPAFSPRSLLARATMLGGRTCVEQTAEATTVTIDIPL